MSSTIGIVAFVASLVLAIVIHELGHLVTATLAAVFDAIDLRFEDSDRALAARPRGTTRARPARVKGIVATAFAEVLERVGLALSPASLSKTYGRLRQRVDAVLAETDRAEPDPGSGRKQRGREPR